MLPKSDRVPSVVWTENILIRSRYLNPVGYSPGKTFLGIAHPSHLISSLIFFVFKPSGYALNLSLLGHWSKTILIRSKKEKYCILPKLFTVTSTLMSLIVRGILWGRKVDNQEKFVICGRLILGRLTSWKIHVSWRLFDYRWSRGWGSTNIVTGSKRSLWEVLLG